MCRFVAASIAVQIVLWPCVLSSRAKTSIDEVEVGGATWSPAALRERALLRLEQIPTKWSATCPYGDKAKALQGGTNGYQCHWKSEGVGNTCPELQKERLAVSRRFFVKNYERLVNEAIKYQLEALFDKSPSLRGDETYEELVQLQVQGLNHKDVAHVEDKILFKKLADTLQVPATNTLFGVHKSGWEREEFAKTLKRLCDSGLDAFFLKAVHLAWSKGQKIITNFQSVCKDAQKNSSFVADLTKFVETEVLGQIASDADTHLRDFVEPGVIMEELWKTGGSSARPLEVKVQLLWGKVHHMWFVGDDARGCVAQPGSLNIYADKTGWDMKGIIGPVGTNDKLTDHFLRFYFDDIADAAEKFAKGVGADLMRADFFIATPENGAIKFAMNEPESVSGHPYWHERHQMATILRDGYIISDRLKMTPGKWDEIITRAGHDRLNNGLDWV